MFAYKHLFAILPSIQRKCVHRPHNVPLCFNINLQFASGMHPGSWWLIATWWVTSGLDQEYDGLRLEWRFWLTLFLRTSLRVLPTHAKTHIILYHEERCDAPHVVGRRYEQPFRRTRLLLFNIFLAYYMPRNIGASAFSRARCFRLRTSVSTSSSGNENIYTPWSASSTSLSDGRLREDPAQLLKILQELALWNTRTRRPCGGGTWTRSRMNVWSLKSSSRAAWLPPVNVNANGSVNDLLRTLKTWRESSPMPHSVAEMTHRWLATLRIFQEFIS